MKPPGINSVFDVAPSSIPHPEEQESLLGVDQEKSKARTKAPASPQILDVPENAGLLKHLRAHPNPLTPAEAGAILADWDYYPVRMDAEHSAVAKLRRISESSEPEKCCCRVCGAPLDEVGKPEPPRD